jgi:hypothetical protein
VKLPVDFRALWERALAWYNGYGQRDQRIILGVLIAVGASIVYLGVIDPIVEYRKDRGKKITDAQFELEQSMRFVGKKDTLRAEREDLRKRLTQAKSRLLPGVTGTLGAAALQERANSLASEKGIAVQSTQVMKEEAADPFRKVAVRLTLSGELKPLAEVVAALEYQQQLAVPFVEISRRGAVAGAKGPRTLSITLEVSGFVQGTPTKSETAEADAAAVAGEAGTAPADGTAGAGEAPGDAQGDGAVTTGEGVPAAPTPGAEAAPAPPTPNGIPLMGGAPTPGGTPAGGATANGATAAPATTAPATTAPGTTAPAPAGATPSSTPTTVVPITFPTMVIPTPAVPTTVPSPAVHPVPVPPSHDGGADDNDDGDGE